MDNILSYISADFQANAMLIFGLFLLLGVFGGVLANRLSWMPTITAFMLLGMLMGPSGFGIISKQMLVTSSVVVDIALGLILYKLGNMLHPRAMMRSKRLVVSACLEAGLTFLMIFAGMLALGQNPVLSALVAAISISSSPAVLVHVAEELEADGPVTARAKSLVALNNFISFLFFSAVMPFAIAGGGGSIFAAILLPLYKLAGSLIVGIFVAWLVTRISYILTDRADHYRFALVIGAIMMTVGICDMLGASKILAPLVLGNAVCWMESSRHRLSKVGIGESGDLFFIALFVMAGAKINIGSLADIGLLTLFLVMVRIFAKTSGIFAAGIYFRIPREHSLALSLLLAPMASMAIGLTGSVMRHAPDYGSAVASIIFAMVAIFEAVGPFLAIYALRRSGEAGKKSLLQQRDSDL